MLLMVMVTAAVWIETMRWSCVDQQPGAGLLVEVRSPGSLRESSFKRAFTDLIDRPSLSLVWCPHGGLEKSRWFRRPSLLLWRLLRSTR